MRRSPQSTATSFASNPDAPRLLKLPILPILSIHIHAPLPAALPAPSFSPFVQAAMGHIDLSSCVPPPPLPLTVPLYTNRSADAGLSQVF
jgi:hypothetical protein